LSTDIVAGIDRLIEYFNKRTLDLPDGLFDRRAQFVINGTPFEALLSATPNDALVLMLSRGPAGYRFTVKALQHAIPDAKLDRREVAADADRITVTLQLGLSGTLRDSKEPIRLALPVTLQLNVAGSVTVAAVTILLDDLQKIQRARLSP